MDIRKKMAKGIFWLFLEKGLQQISSFIVFAIIARLIGPEEYGLVGLCGIFLSLAINIINGLVDAVISMHIKDNKRLSTLFWIVVCCGASLSLFTYFSADVFAQIMEHEKLAPLLRSYAPLPILLALASIPTALITESMNFRVFTIRTLAATLIAGIVGIYMAFNDYGAYALVVQQIVLYSVINLVVWPSCDWRPGLVFNKQGMREVLKLGLAQSGSSLVTFAEGQMPKFILGLFLGPTVVGYYTFAQRISYAIQDGIAHPLISVLYPAVSQIRNNYDEQKRVFVQFIVGLGNCLLPTIFGAIVTAPLYVPLFFGEKWASAVPALQLFILIVFPACMHLALRDYMRGHKKITSFIKYQLVYILSMLAACFLSVPFGYEAFVLVYAILAFIATIGYSYLVQKETNISLWGGYLRLWAPLAASLAMFGALNFFISQSPEMTGRVLLLMESFILGVVVYGILSIILQFNNVKTVIRIFTRLRQQSD